MHLRYGSPDDSPRFFCNPWRADCGAQFFSSVPAAHSFSKVRRVSDDSFFMISAPVSSKLEQTQTACRSAFHRFAIPPRLSKLHSLQSLAFAKVLLRRKQHAGGKTSFGRILWAYSVVLSEVPPARNCRHERTAELVPEKYFAQSELRQEQLSA